MDGALSYKVYRSLTTGVYGATSLLKSGVAALTYSDDGSDSLVSGTPPASTNAGHAVEIILINDMANFTIA